METKPVCKNCGGPISPVRFGRIPTRFCSRQCSDEWYQLERRQAVELFRAQGMKVRTEQGQEEQEQRSASA